MAERLLQHALAAEPEPLRSLRVESAGVAARDGVPVTRYSVRALSKVGIDLRDHQSQPVSADHMERALLILVMTESHRSVIESLYPDSEVPVLLFRELLGPDEETQIPDPYGLDLQYYEATRDSLVEAIPSLLRYLRELTGANERAG